MTGNVADEMTYRDRPLNEHQSEMSGHRRRKDASNNDSAADRRRCYDCQRNSLSGGVHQRSRQKPVRAYNFMQGRPAWSRPTVELLISGVDWAAEWHVRISMKSSSTHDRLQPLHKIWKEMLSMSHYRYPAVRAPKMLYAWLKNGSDHWLSDTVELPKNCKADWHCLRNVRTLMEIDVLM